MCNNFVTYSQQKVRSQKIKNSKIELFKRKAAALKSFRKNSSGYHFKSPEGGLEAAYLIALQIGRNKKPHTMLVGDKLIKPCLLDAVISFLESNMQKR